MGKDDNISFIIRKIGQVEAKTWQVITRKN